MHDMLVYNAKIYTMQSENHVFSAMIINKGIITKLLKENPQNPFHVASEVLNAENKAILPGFIDTHAHFIATAALNAVGFPITEMKDGKLYPTTLDGVKKKVQDFIKNSNSKKPLFCINYVIASIEENRLPYTQEIDSWVPNRDVIFLTIDVHSSSYSSSALKKMGFDPHKHNGILTGEEHENNYNKMMDILKSALSLPILWKGIQNTLIFAIKHGIVEINCMEGLDGTIEEKSLKRFHHIAKCTPISLRLFPQVRDVSQFNSIKQKMLFPRAGGCGHWEIDGAVGAQSAAFYDDYKNQLGNKGTILYPMDLLIKDLDRAYSLGYQITSHALGTRAIDHLLEAIQKVFLKHNDKSNKLRWRIDHFEFPSHKAIQLAIRELKLLIVPQPGFNWIDANYPGMQTYDKFLEPEIVALQNPLRTIIRNGGIICGSSDSPVQDMNPFLQIHGMVNFPIQSEQISVYEAIKTYTYNAAFSNFEEQTRGTLTEKLSADFIILDQDPFSIPKSDLLNIKVNSMYIKGKCIKPKKKGILHLLKCVLFRKSPKI